MQIVPHHPLHSFIVMINNVHNGINENIYMRNAMDRVVLIVGEEEKGVGIKGKKGRL